ncbi:MAG TPA: hypothetical protein VD704_04920 [Gaiellaceae bacterium]|nr:hypothetical protein [Gaiellaceae bacterium]
MESEGVSVAWLLGEASDSAMLCRVFVQLAEQGDSPSPSTDYSLALEQIRDVIDYLEEAQELLRSRFANRNANPS